MKAGTSSRKSDPTAGAVDLLPTLGRSPVREENCQKSAAGRWLNDILIAEKPETPDRNGYAKDSIEDLRNTGVVGAPVERAVEHLAAVVLKTMSSPIEKITTTHKSSASSERLIGCAVDRQVSNGGFFTVQIIQF